MIVCINCKKETKDKMDRLVGNEAYRDYSELIEAAIDNLFVLEREIGEKGAIVIEDDVSYDASSQKSIRPAAKANVNNRKQIKAKSVPSFEDVPVVFSLDGLDREKDFPSCELEAPEELKGVYTLDQWIFGQYNKLLPAKASCRALLRYARKYPDGIPLEEAAEEISVEVGMLGDYLAAHDEKYGIGRDDALATAFPRSGPEGSKSRSRYASQFVGLANSQGEISGLLKDYRLIAKTASDDVKILPTNAGIMFALMVNPVLDQKQEEPKQKFSPEEIEFLISHIEGQAPVEFFAFQTLIKAISQGADTPGELDAALSGLTPSNPERSFSQSFLTSQRSGALSRMVDLRLIARERKGVKVSYSIK